MGGCFAMPVWFQRALFDPACGTSDQAAETRHSIGGKRRFAQCWQHAKRTVFAAIERAVVPTGTELIRVSSRSTVQGTAVDGINSQSDSHTYARVTASFSQQLVCNLYTNYQQRIVAYCHRTTTDWQVQKRPIKSDQICNQSTCTCPQM